MNPSLYRRDFLFWLFTIALLVSVLVSAYRSDVATDHANGVILKNQATVIANEERILANQALFLARQKQILEQLATIQDAMKRLHPERW